MFWNAMLVASKASCCVANTFSTGLKVVWPRSSLKITKMSETHFLQKVPGVNGLSLLINNISWIKHIHLMIPLCRLADMKEVTGELRRRIEAEQHERRTANQQNQLRWVKRKPFHNRPFYSCKFSDLASEWWRGWRWPYFDTDFTAFIMQIKLFLC